MKKFLFITLLLPLLGCSQGITSEHSDSTLPSETNKQRLETNKLENSSPFRKYIKYTNIGIEPDQQKAEVKKENKILLDVPLIKQNPELKYGCEVTSLTMMLQFAGVKINKMELYNQIKKDLDPVIKDHTGNILKWGNPAVGFVGDMTGKTPGYAVYDKPIEALINRHMPRRAINLTNQSFDEVLNHVSKGYPVVVWTTGGYRLPDRWESWKHGNEVIKTPMDLHAVVLVGYDDQHVYLNDPLTGKKQVMVKKDQFIASWQALKSRAVSYK